MSSVTVIMPVHNGEKYVSQALRSIAAQGDSVSEVIVIDDASTDQTMTLVAEFEQSSLVQFRTIRTAGVGQSAARNEGAQLATGDYLAFLDQDDIWLQGHAASLKAILDDNPSTSMVYSDVNTIDADGGLLIVRLNALAGNGHPKRSITEILEGDIMALPSATMVRRTDFLSIGGFDERLQGYEDDDLYFRGFRAGWNPTFVTGALVHYRVHGSGSSMSPTFRASRLRFAANISSTVPDNPRTRTYFIRDFLIPRLRQSFMMDYATALTIRDHDTARAIASDLRALLVSSTGRTSGQLNVRIRAGLWLLSHPGLAKIVLRSRPTILRRGGIPAELRFRA
ncbi:unannotated protein [freshwater metagenome]|uniref:Unannotated protein n=1 Tax=freshwater metagenome TaxID=449393 RepID=A0A6J6D5G6_9ZZZZ|nr:glycosyltransferase [Actinomycetota bacterium]